MEYDIIFDIMRIYVGPSKSLISYKMEILHRFCSLRINKFQTASNCRPNLEQVLEIWAHSKQNQTVRVEMNVPTCRSRVVIVPFPLQGHITPMLQLGTILHSQGFSVTVLHPEYNSPDSSNHPEFLFLALSDNLSGNAILSSNAFQFAKAINRNCRSSIWEHLARLKELHGGVACVVYDSTMEVADLVASDLDVPIIMVAPPVLLI